MMAVVSLSLAGEMLAQRRHIGQEEQRLRDHAAGLAIVLAPLLGGSTAGERAEIEQLLRPSIGSLGIVGIEVHRFVGDETATIVALGLAGDVPAARPLADVDGEVASTNGWLVVDRPIRTFGPEATRPRLVLRLLARSSPWTTLADWRETVLLALGVGLVSFVLGVLLLELQVLRPLARLRARTAEIGGGQLDARADLDGPAEVRALAVAFNEMTDKLAARADEVAAQRAELVRAEQLASIGRIAAGTAHEVGNPLATMLGYVELLLDERTEPRLGAEHREMLERVREQTLRIKKLVGQLLEYSRPPRTEPDDVAIAPLVDRVVALVRHDARCSGVAIEVAHGEVGAARADPSLLEQVLVNLVVNAARAARSGATPRVEVRCILHDANVVIDVIDNGPGVPTELRPHLFEPFVTTAKAGEGTGLGLAISQGLVERMGGTLACLSGGSPIGVEGSPGAVFRVTLPRAASPTAPSAGGVRSAANASDPATV
jgi:two-component system, NtrC family, sensor kinase